MYKTIQYKSLCDFFERGEKEQYTSEEIATALEQCGVSRSTVYRQLAKMTEAGELRRFQSGRQTLYQYANATESCGSHFHLKCESCGRLIHLDCESAAEFARHIAAGHGFELDMQRTVLYGVCRRCAEKKGDLSE